MWGSGNASREFLYADDAAEGIVLATERYDAVEPLNLGTGIETTIRDLVQRLCTVMDFFGAVEWDASQPDGHPRRYLDVTRAQREIGFVARTSLEDGLRATVAWFESTARVGSV